MYDSERREVIVTHSDARVFGYCNRGIRLFCKRYGFDYNDFRHNGVKGSDLLATGDYLAEKLVEFVKNGRRR